MVVCGKPGLQHANEQLCCGGCVRARVYDTVRGSGGAMNASSSHKISTTDALNYICPRSIAFVQCARMHARQCFFTLVAYFNRYARGEGSGVEVCRSSKISVHCYCGFILAATHAISVCTQWQSPLTCTLSRTHAATNGGEKRGVRGMWAVADRCARTRLMPTQHLIAAGRVQGCQVHRRIAPYGEDAGEPH